MSSGLLREWNSAMLTMEIVVEPSIDDSISIVIGVDVYGAGCVPSVFEVWSCVEKTLGQVTGWKGIA